MTEMDLTAGAHTKVRMTFATIGAIIVFLWATYRWHFDTFVVMADVPTKQEIRDIKASDRVLESKLEQYRLAQERHIRVFEEGQKIYQLKEIQALINDTNDKLFALQQFPDDSRRQAQERELKQRLGDYELQKQCLLSGNTLCD